MSKKCHFLNEDCRFEKNRPDGMIHMAACVACLVSRLVKETDEETGEYSKFKKPIDVILKSREEDRCPFCANTVSQHELPWFCLISQVRDCESPCTVDDWKRCPLRNVPHQKIVDYLR